MEILTIVFFIAVIAFYIIVYIKAPALALKGLKLSSGSLLKMLPLVVAAFALGGLLQVLIPREMISNWLGAKSGIKGILIGSLLGAITPGPLYLSFPIAGGLLKSGASIGTVIAYIIAWEVWGIRRFPMEVAFLGWKFMMVKLVSALVLPPVAGILANLIVQKVIILKGIFRSRTARLC